MFKIMVDPGKAEDPDKWIVDMEEFLSNGIPPEEMWREERKRLGVHTRAYCLSHGNLYHKSADGIWRRVVRLGEVEEILREVHCGVAGGHYAGEATGREVWQSGLWWRIELKDAHWYVKECDICERTGQPHESARIPYELVLPLEPFQNLGLDFVGPFNPTATQTGNKCILAAMDYCTKWVEAKALRDNMALSTVKFL